MISEEQNSDDDCDSGNDEPSDYLPLERRASVSGTPQQERMKGDEEEEAPALTRYTVLVYCILLLLLSSFTCTHLPLERRVSMSEWDSSTGHTMHTS